MSLEKIFGIMNQIATQSSKSVKETILKTHESDMKFREALIFLLNPYIVTGISTRKINKKIALSLEELSVEPLLTDLSDVINYLMKNNTGKDVNINNIQIFIERQESEEIQTFVKKFVTKDLKLGISEKTVNKVYGADTIPTFAVQLAESFAKKGDKLKGLFYITLKLDGNRCISIVSEDGVKFFSRSGKPVEGLVELEEQFKTLPRGVYDGELLLKNTKNLPSAELFQLTQKTVRKDGEKKGLDFHIFDILSIDEFKAGKSKRIYSQRRNTLDIVISNLVEREKTKNITVLPVLYVGEDKNVIPAYTQLMEEKGYEGIMINTANGLYQSKRVVDLLKVKTMHTADLLCVSVEKAIDGQFEGLMSRVNVEYKGGLTGVGSGFTLEQRKHFIENPDDIIGKIIEIQFFEETKDEKTEQPSLRFPVFKCIREDKGVEDIRYE